MSFISTNNAVSAPQSHAHTSGSLLFNQGFTNFFRSGVFSDLTLVTKEGRRYPAHKLLLAYASEYFEKKLNELPHDETELLLERTFDIDFELVLKYMYEGKVELSTDNAVQLLAMADFYEIGDLKKEASNYLVASITRENALQMIQKAIQYNAEEIINKCLQIFAKNFTTLVESGTTFNFLPVDILIRLTQRNNLAVSSETVVYKAVCDYIVAHKDELNQDEIQSLFETVRFPFLSFEQLKEIETNPIVPRPLLFEALLERLKWHEEKKVSTGSNNSGSSSGSVPGSASSSLSNIHDAKQIKQEIESKQDILMNHPNDQIINTSNNRNSGGNHSNRFIPRETYSISLEYVYDLDDNGVFYYIGTKGSTEVFSNPAVRGRVRVSSSSAEKGSVVNILEKSPKEFWTMDVPSSWIQVSLGSTRTLIPNYYTLRHGGYSKADCLRNWTLQGSNDGKNWTVIKRHVNDTSLNGNFATASWAIPDCTRSFKHFRILQTGRNSSYNNFLSVSGFELYGDLYDDKKGGNSNDGYTSP